MTKEELKPIDTSKYKITETGQVLKMTKEEMKMTKDKMKDRISTALKDPVLQQGFEIICKNLEELEKENAELKSKNCWKTCEYAELKSKNCWKTCEYAEPKSQWISQHIQDVAQLSKAKEIIKEILSILPKENIEGVYEITEEAEQFIRED